MGITYNKGTAILVQDVAALEACSRVEVDGLHLILGVGDAEAFRKFLFVVAVVGADDSAVLRSKPCFVDNIRYSPDRVKEHMVVGAFSALNSVHTQRGCYLYR